MACARETWPAQRTRSVRRCWPQDGVPQKPEAWLLATARRRLINRVWHERVPEESELPPRLDAVLDAIYTAPMASVGRMPPMLIRVGTG